MAFLNNMKTFALKTELDLFTTKPVQNCVEFGSYQENRPVSVLDSESPIEFVISESSDYIDLSLTQIHLRLKILHEDGTALSETDPVAPVNNFLHSLFDHVAIVLNGKTITQPSNLYNFRAYIETLLNYSEEAKKGHLASGLFCKDVAGQFDDVTSAGFVARKAYMKNGLVELTGYIHSELMSQDKFLINFVPIQFKFYRSKPSFCLMTTEADQNNGYKIVIQDAILLVRKVKINPSIMIAHDKALLRSNVKMPINRIDVKSISISKDTQAKSLDNIYIGKSVSDD